jgi:hypothetical protein
MFAGFSSLRRLTPGLKTRRFEILGVLTLIGAGAGYKMSTNERFQRSITEVMNHRYDNRKVKDPQSDEVVKELQKENNTGTAKISEMKGVFSPDGGIVSKAKGTKISSYIISRHKKI